MMKKKVFILCILNVIFLFISCETPDINSGTDELDNNTEIYKVDRGKIERPGNQYD
jgi:hypothetical protein